MYKQHAQNTIGKGGYSFIKTGSKGTVKLFTKSPAKVAFIQFLGLDRSTPEQVAVRGWDSVGTFTMIEVKRLSTFEFADPENFACSCTAGLPNSVLAEIERYRRLDLMHVADIDDIDLSRLPILRPALEFVKSYFYRTTPLMDDMHNENFLLDRETHKTIPYDVFVFEDMEKRGRLVNP